jgi:hypothetical protein
MKTEVDYHMVSNFKEKKWSHGSTDKSESELTMNCKKPTTAGDWFVRHGSSFGHGASSVTEH